MTKYVIALDHIDLPIREKSEEKAHSLFAKLVKKNQPETAGLFVVKKGELLPLALLTKQHPQGMLH